jgi:CheY-like chemotaxis protein
MSSIPQAKVLWADDEIAHLKAHILFLEEKGMRVTAVSNGADAIRAASAEDYDIVFLDEHMPGLSGLETLARLKEAQPSIPVVMITKSEAEDLMENAIGSKISDYLIKPVNPHQILSSCKKILDGRLLVGQKVNSGYLKDFSAIGSAVSDRLDTSEWMDVYRKLVFWEIELENTEDTSLREVLASQKTEANVGFTKHIQANYLKWMAAPTNARPLLSPDLFSERVFPLMEAGEKAPVVMLLIDCLRYDQWKAFETILSTMFSVESEELYLAILPTATQYARNAIFAGMFPLEISEKYPKSWVADDEEGGKNLHEHEFLQEQFTRRKIAGRPNYHKIVSNEEGKNFSDNVLNLLRHDFSAIVVNFLDLLTHSRSEMNLVKDLAPDEAGFRALATAWLEHSWLLAALRKLRDKKVKIIITTDHGSIRVNKPLKIIGDRHTTTNLRYKHGRNLSYDENARQIFTVRKPELARLPKSSLSGTYAFAAEDGYFVYPNNYNHFVALYKDSFQHGGLSLEEMLVPFVVLSPKG